MELPPMYEGHHKDNFNFRCPHTVELYVQHAQLRSQAAKSLLNLLWLRVAQMVSFLEPLNDVTKILCCSKFPNLSMGLRISIFLIKNIYDIRTKYNTFQLIPAAEQMIEKLKKYFSFNTKYPISLLIMPSNPLNMRQKLLITVRPTSLEKPHLQMILVLKLTSTYM
ncbi:uncharacterized protein VP01_4823g3 [Puccinia sorghi]|uniref:Uncharacterized protein n=1 Tax=Puccinia sorghi TaxID=27349 RepID=A0A0L6UMG8_9BASI|nr:uncharacterized protein VP01_4823g3 [Puccinia sorghi]